MGNGKTLNQMSPYLIYLHGLEMPVGKTALRGEKGVQPYLPRMAIVFFIESEIGCSGHRVVDRENIGLDPIRIHNIRLSTAIIDLKK